MKYIVKFYDAFYGNFSSYEIKADSYEEVERDAEEGCSVFQWFEIIEIKD